MAFLLSSAKLATSIRLMGIAERNLKRDEEAEATLVSAISVFRGDRIRTCLQKLYAEADNVMDSGGFVRVPQKLWLDDRFGMCVWGYLGGGGEGGGVCC